MREWLECQKRPSSKNIATVIDYESRIAENPDDVVAYIDMGHFLHVSREYELALQMFDEALSVAPDHVHGLMSRADLLATCPIPSVRDGRQAVADSEAALRLANNKGSLEGLSYMHRIYLMILAAAYAEVGDYSKSRASLSSAINVCKTKRGKRDIQRLIELVDRAEPIRPESGLIRSARGPA